jgi:arylsulfatase A-like enzyme
MANASVPTHGPKGARWIFAILVALFAGCGGDAGDDANEQRAAPAARSPSGFAFARHPDEAELASPLPASGSGRAERGPSFESLTLGNTSRFGISMPVPSTASWEVGVPPRAQVEFTAAVPPPAAPTPGASGAAGVALEVGEGDTWTEVGRVAGSRGDWERHRFDLSRWAGRRVQVRFRSFSAGRTPGETIFLGEPALFAPRSDPERVALIFVDTLRADHLGIYGYERSTSPLLDRWAEAAVVFEAARAPSPWTLPSARAVLSGRQPESWFEAPNLPERMAEAGFLTLAVVSNPYLAASFDMHRGWSEHTARNKRPADELVDAAIAFLEAHADRDLLLLVHFMDTHLPYREPPAYRELWAEPGREGAEEFVRGDLLKLDPGSGDFPRRRRETIDRYDQNIRFVDAELARLLAVLGSDATVVFFSDHGEEFWDHGRAEHGHSFHEELLRVPLILRDPRLPPGRCPAPVTLIDVAPSVLELAGLDSGRGTGRSLVDAARGNAAAIARLEERPLAFGRPLYGADGWGVTQRGMKWYSQGGGQFLYDLRRDPGETSNLTLGGGADLSPYPAVLSEALGREVRLVWRILLLSPASRGDVVLTLRHPSGIERAWPTYDPNEDADWSAPEIVDGALRIVQSAGESMPRAVYVLPAGDPLDPRGLSVSLSGDGSDVTATYTGSRLGFAGGTGATVFEGGDDRRRFAVFFAYVPVPSGVEVPAFAPDAAEELRELGYVE